MDIKLNSSTSPYTSSQFVNQMAAHSNSLLSQKLQSQGAADLLTSKSKENAPIIDSLDLSDAASLNAPSAEAGSIDGQAPRDALRNKGGKKETLKETFEDFVGQTFFSELVKSLRSTQKGAAYMNGGRAEEIFQGQLDQVLTDHLTEASADKIAEPMYKQFMLKQPNQ